MTAQPKTLHEAITTGIERALRDLGVDLVGCPPSTLTGHVIRELKRIPGFQGPPRRIETPAELDALPELSVIRTAEGRVIEKVGSFPDPDQFGFRSDWMSMESEFTLGTDEIDDLPATVLYEPEEADRG